MRVFGQGNFSSRRKRPVKSFSSMRFVAAKTEEQQEIQALHRTRESRISAITGGGGRAPYPAGVGCNGRGGAAPLPSERSVVRYDRAQLAECGLNVGDAVFAFFPLRERTGILPLWANSVSAPFSLRSAGWFALLIRSASQASFSFSARAGVSGLQGLSLMPVPLGVHCRGLVASMSLPLSPPGPWFVDRSRSP